MPIFFHPGDPRMAILTTRAWETTNRGGNSGWTNHAWNDLDLRPYSGKKYSYSTHSQNNQEHNCCVVTKIRMATLVPQYGKKITLFFHHAKSLTIKV